MKAVLAQLWRVHSGRMVFPVERTIPLFHQNKLKSPLSCLKSDPRRFSIFRCSVKFDHELARTPELGSMG